MRLGTTLAIIAVISLLLVCPRSTGQQRKCPPGIPNHNITFNESSKSVTVFVEGNDSVYARLVYSENSLCRSCSRVVPIDPAESRSAVFSDIYWLHCACLQVYFACNNAPRSYKKCLLTNSRLPYVNDVWHSSKFELKVNSLKMKYLCTVAETNICTVLCWKHDGYCTVVFDLSLVEERNKKSVEYNISAIDKHPQMCVQRSLQGSHNITCHFTADMSSWMVNIETRRQSIFVHINSTVPAKFSVQLCKLNLNACASIGEIQSLNTKEKLTTFQLSVLSVGERPCVQVWQSEPALYGKRILCPDYTRRRYGVYAAAALVCALITIVLGICFHRLTKKGTAGWLYIQRPILLVCSSEDDVHVSTVCALASVLQGDLGATVHLALWGQSVQSPYGMRVADVGPLPWLHGQWDSVIKAQGIVLIMWSLDAKITYKNWWSDKESSNQKDLISHGPHKIEYSTTLTEKYKLRREDKHIPERTNVSDCSVIAPVFKAALTCLVGALQENKPQKVTFVSLHGHNSSKDIPKVFKGVPHYCLPHQFSGLLQELGVKMRRSQNSKVHCWTRLMSKILCFWLAKQLVRRLRATPQ